MSLQLPRPIAINPQMRSHTIHAEAHDGLVGLLRLSNSYAACSIADEITSEERSSLRSWFDARLPLRARSLARRRRVCQRRAGRVILGGHSSRRGCAIEYSNRRSGCCLKARGGRILGNWYKLTSFRRWSLASRRLGACHVESVSKQIGGAQASLLIGPSFFESLSAMAIVSRKAALQSASEVDSHTLVAEFDLWSCHGDGVACTDRLHLSFLRFQCELLFFHRTACVERQRRLLRSL